MPTVQPFQRSPEVQAAFDHAKVALRQRDSFIDPTTGGMLSNFPIQSFDRADQAPPRWPTFGIKLSARQIAMSQDRPAGSTVGEAIDCLRTMITEWDRYHLDAETARSTIFVDCGTIASTDFAITTQAQQQLFDRGCQAATQFLVARAAAVS